jgi:hypothetical protein
MRTQFYCDTNTTIIEKHKVCLKSNECKPESSFPLSSLNRTLDTIIEINHNILVMFLLSNKQNNKLDTKQQYL